MQRAGRLGQAHDQRKAPAALDHLRYFFAFDQSALATEAGIGFVARKASCEYLRPARLDDELTIALEVEKLTRVRVIFRQQARRADQVLVTGTVEIACVNMSTMTPSPIPDFLYSKLEALK